MKKLKNLFYILIIIPILSGCVQTNEESTNDTDTDTSISVGPLGTNLDVFEDEDPQYYYVDPETVITVYIQETEEESFDYESEILNFERTESGFEFTFINFQDEEITKSFEIKSSSVVKDENGTLFEWNPPADWTIFE